MFVQVMRGQLADEAAMLTALERWDAELRPGAEGFLGSTAGTTTDGQFVLMVRFADEATARRNSDRPEQGLWWAEAERAFAGPVHFFESSDVDLSLAGGSDEAGFVQILVGAGGDREQARQVLIQGEDVLRRERPDIIGGITAWREDGSFVDIAYFRSEAEARAGESQELSADGRALFEKIALVMPVQEYVDLPDPRFA